MFQNQEQVQDSPIYFPDETESVSHMNGQTFRSQKLTIQSHVDKIDSVGCNTTQQDRVGKWCTGT